ncbi:hypothetical protein BDV35DRAFT_283186 [Aspergillus flavus]|uniref:Uncharacterized protein n=1 Tax=Aspergillus flavus TaxID=5059 RepID=A0A5N6GTF4_ASPFL|nr:hypothetical protein BDV35DRAFT_283186 [Aspergillus flavus]
MPRLRLGCLCIAWLEAGRQRQDVMTRCIQWLVCILCISMVYSPTNLGRTSISRSLAKLPLPTDGYDACKRSRICLTLISDQSKFLSISQPYALRSPYAYTYIVCPCSSSTSIAA